MSDAPVTLSRRAGALVALVVLTGCSGGSGGSSGAVPAPLAPAEGTPGISVEQQQALDEVERVAPALESYYRSAGYPTSTAEAVESARAAGIVLAAGSSITGYDFDETATEFLLCVETSSGAWATYDTAPMALQETGPAGGCPQD